MVFIIIEGNTIYEVELLNKTGEIVIHKRPDPCLITIDGIEYTAHLFKLSIEDVESEIFGNEEKINSSAKVDDNLKFNNRHYKFSLLKEDGLHTGTIERQNDMLFLITRKHRYFIGTVVGDRIVDGIEVIIAERRRRGKRLVSSDDLVVLPLEVIVFNKLIKG